MFTLKKLLAPIFLPPGIIVLILIGYGVFLFFRKHRLTAAINISIGLILWMLSTAPVSNYLIGSLESRCSVPASVDGDVLILLGGGIIDSEVPDLSGTGWPVDEMCGRIITAVRLQKKLKLPIIISGGSSKPQDASEAEIVRRIMIDLGVDDAQIILEDKSRDTYENALYSKMVCNEHNFKKPILLTSAYSIYRAVEAFEKVGLGVLPYPTNFYAYGEHEYGFHSYLPKAYSLWLSSSALYEYLGKIFYNLVYYR